MHFCLRTKCHMFFRTYHFLQTFSAYKKAAHTSKETKKERRKGSIIQRKLRTHDEERASGIIQQLWSVENDIKQAQCSYTKTKALSIIEMQHAGSTRCNFTPITELQILEDLVFLNFRFKQILSMCQSRTTTRSKAK